jgi:hypothetical protein
MLRLEWMVERLIKGCPSSLYPRDFVLLGPPLAEIILIRLGRDSLAIPWFQLCCDGISPRAAAFEHILAGHPVAQNQRSAVSGPPFVVECRCLVSAIRCLTAGQYVGTGGPDSRLRTTLIGCLGSARRPSADGRLDLEGELIWIEDFGVVVIHQLGKKMHPGTAWLLFAGRASETMFSMGRGNESRMLQGRNGAVL